MTTLLEWQKDPAKTLIELYHERWEEELAIDELKTHQRERPMLRSQTPAGAIQEIYGLLLGHYVVRKLMCEAAIAADVAPRRTSFTATLKILRCLLPERRDRINPRQIKCKMSKLLKKRPEHRRNPQQEKKFRETVEIIC